MARPKKGAGLPLPPRQVWALRLTSEAFEFLRSVADFEGRPRSAVALRCIEEARVLREVLGADWFELERQAKVEGVSTAVVLGRLAKVAIEKDRKK